MGGEPVNLLLYLHPVWQTASLLLMVVALSLGLRLGRERAHPWEREARLRLQRLHLKVAITFLGLISTGYALGIATMAFVRDEPVFRTAHAYFGTIVLGLFWLGAYYGGRLLRGQNLKPKDYSNHAFCVILGAIIALAVAVMGYTLLP
ncbi:MAG: hypothetical protein Q8R92_05460 [Deltaproteobacteria bacterium]|nr:hypothetical protein [Deltaproteobacteria bacterium]